MQAPALRFDFRHWPAAALRLLVLVLLTAPTWAWTQQAEQIDPPGRVAYISLKDGTALMATDGRGSWTPATLNMPVTTGVSLATEGNSRTELHSGWSAFRLTGKSALEVTELGDNSTRLALTEGTLSARVRELQPGERFEVNTPNIALVAKQPGEYRFDVDPNNGTTRLTVHSGSATVYGDAGQAIAVGARDQWLFSGRSLDNPSRTTVTYRDAFDQWVSSRDALEDRSNSVRYVSAGTPGYQQLDTYGDWAQDVTYGAVWYPRLTVNDWAPYRYGQWSWVDPWGWTWVDDAPWGFAPFHYGRWTQIGPRWAWVPGPIVRRPVYAPALVGFVGGTSGGASWGISLGSGSPGAAWFPLAPGEYWEPSYRASQRYRHALNPWPNARPPRPSNDFHFQRRPNAITFGPRDQFGAIDGRRPRFTNGGRLSPDQWSGTRMVPPPPRPNNPGISGERNPRNAGDRGASPPPRPQITTPDARWQTPRDARETQRQLDRSNEWQRQQGQQRERERERERDRELQQRQQFDQNRAAQQQREQQQQQMIDRQRDMREQQRQIDQRRAQQQERQFEQRREQQQLMNQQRQMLPPVQRDREPQRQWQDRATQRDGGPSWRQREERGGGPRSGGPSSRSEN